MFWAITWKISIFFIWKISFFGCKYTKQNNFRAIYTNFGRVYGQNHRRYQNIIECFFKRKPLKECFQHIFLNQNFHFKIRKKTLLFTPELKNWHFCVKSDVWAPNCEKNHRESLICYQETHVLLEVPSTDYSLSTGNFRGIVSLSKGWPLFWPYLCAFYWKEGWVCTIFCVTEYCFH